MQTHKQRGFTVLGAILLAMAIAFIGLIGIRLVPIYIQNYTLGQALAQLAKHPPTLSDDYLGGGKGGLKRTLLKRLDIDGMRSITAKDIHITQVRGSYKVDVKYTVQVKMIGNIDALVKFDNSVMVKPSDS